MKHSLIIVSLLFVFACQSEKKSEAVAETKVAYDMYVPSEMSILMNRMYELNLQLKASILNGETPTAFPEEFVQIHTAELSEFKSRNETFNSFSNLYIEKQQAVFNPEAKDDLKERYNNTIKLCISCHQTECTGPIPKIKKLLIE